MFILIFLDLTSFSVMVRGLRARDRKLSVKVAKSPKETLLTGKQASLTLTLIDKLPATPILLAPLSHYHYQAHAGATLGAISADRVTFGLASEDEVYVSLAPDAKDAKVLSPARLTLSFCLPGSPLLLAWLSFCLPDSPFACLALSFCLPDSPFARLTLLLLA
jgi:hypothetical protein